MGEVATGLIDMHKKKWADQTKYIKINYENLSPEEQSAFDVLCDYWRHNNFNKEECNDCIDVLKREANKHGNMIELKTNLQNFRELCSRYYTKSEVEYMAFQKAMGGKPRKEIVVPPPTPRREETTNVRATTTTARRDDSQTGYGRIDYDGGDYYIGERLKGKRNGYGKYFFANGSWAEGNFVNDAFTCTHGRRYYQDGQRTDSGNYNNWNRVGKGRMEWTNGEWAEGEWNDKGLHGHGQAFYPNWNNASFTGEFINGRRCYGRISWPDGDWYEGEFKDGNITGRGTHYWKDRDRTIRGIFRDANANGAVEVRWSDGSRYVGDWILNSSTDQYEGVGTLYDSDGSAEKGRWDNGTWIRNRSFGDIWRGIGTVLNRSEERRVGKEC